MSALPIPVYLQQLGLEQNPFPVTPDEDGIFFSPRLAAQFTELCHFIELRKGFMLITGDVGVGKSTLARRLLARLEAEGTRSALVFNTFLQGLDLLRAITRDFGIVIDGAGLEAHLQGLNDWLLLQHAAGHNCVLILDDAQGLDVSSLELIRQLSNLEASRAKLLQIVMVAQPEINTTLARHDLRQLTSRIALRLELLPLSLEETNHYLHHRLMRSGNPNAFTIDPRAMKQLHRVSGGYIRRLHLVIDRCLFGLHGRERAHVDLALMHQAAAELGLGTPAVRARSAWRHPRSWLLLAVLLATASLVPGAGWQHAHARLMQLLAAPAARALATPPTDVDTETSTGAYQPTATAPAPAAGPSAWSRFVQAHDGFDWQAPAPTTGAQVHAGMPVRSDQQPWVAALLQPEVSRNCFGQPTYALTDSQLTLFRTPLPTAPLAFGHKGPEVRQLQRALARQQRLQHTDVDGRMGPKTAWALAGFQLQNGLLASGQPDPGTSYLLTCPPNASGGQTP